MIERLEKISAEIFKNALKTFTSKDVLSHKRAHANNLSEILMMFPNRGVDFFVRKKSWSPALYYEIKRSTCKSNKHATFYGLKHSSYHPESQQLSLNNHPKRLQGLSKRGLWTYSLGNFKQCLTDNEIKYTREDFEAFMKVTSIGVSKQLSSNESNSQQSVSNKS